MNWYKKANTGVRSYVFFQDRETQSIAEASLLEEDLLPNTKGMYFFNRLKSNKPGKGGGSKVLRQLLEYIENVGVPLLNQVNAYGNMSQAELVSFYKKYGFVPFSIEFGDDLLVYWPKNIVEKKEDSKKQPKEKIVPPFARSMSYSSNLSWYKLAVLEYQLHKEAGVKEGILAALLSILSSISLPYEAKVIKNLLDKHNVDQAQQQKIVSTVNTLTDQNKNIDELNIDDIKAAIENVKKDLREKNMSDQDVAGELNIEELKDTIRRHEGKSNKVYLDPSKKNWCVGHGFNLNKPNSKAIIKSVGADYNAIMSGKQSLSDAQVEKILDISVKEAVDIASNFVANYNQLPSKAKLVIANMAFMGRGTLGKFNDLRDALAKNDYNKAADEMLDSLWAKQVGRRATELAEMMRSLG